MSSDLIYKIDLTFNLRQRSPHKCRIKTNYNLEDITLNSYDVIAVPGNNEINNIIINYYKTRTNLSLSFVASLSAFLSLHYTNKEYSEKVNF